jgi:pyruvate/2-oxoglutarate dehydrogenase complex dihydrolipoamide acyltransferase (E2) component
MKISLKLGRVGMQMEEAVIAKWHVVPGDAFAVGAVLYEIETEKVTQEVEAPGSGTLLEIKVPEGESAAVGQVVCIVDMDLTSPGGGPA